MAGSPFSEYEQRFLLAEVLKATHVPIARLVEFLRDEDAEPNWRYVGLPAGRSVDECETTYRSLVEHDELPPYNPNLAPYTPGSQSFRARGSYVPGGYAASSTRIIKPKVPYGASTSNGGTPSAPYSGRKRGRPSKADLERRAQEAAARADEEGMGISIGADGAVMTAAAGQKRKAEGEPEDGSEELDLVQQAQGALAQAGQAQAMPAANMMGESGTPVKRGRGRPRKIRPEEQQQQHLEHQTGQQHVDGQEPSQNPSYAPDMRHIQNQGSHSPERIMVEQIQAEAQRSHTPQYSPPEPQTEQGTQQAQQPEDTNDAMRFFRGLNQQAPANMGGQTGGQGMAAGSGTAGAPTGAQDHGQQQ